MAGDSTSVSVSLPSTLVDRLDTLVAAGLFESRAEALQYGARLVVREEANRTDSPLDPVEESPPGRSGGSRSARE